MNPLVSPILRRCLEVIREVILELPATDDCWGKLVHDQGIEWTMRAHADFLIAALPNLCDALGVILDDPLEMPDNRMFASMAINYVIMPCDLISDSRELGRYGLLDDVLLVRDTCVRMQADCTPELSALLESTEASFRAIVETLPDGLREKLRAVSSMCYHNADLLLKKE